MGLLEANDPAVLASYEGLVYATTRRYHTRIEAPFEDIQQALRLKVWRALIVFDVARAGTTRDTRGRTPQDRYVFTCVANEVKDLLKRRQHGEIAIEDLVSGGAHEDTGGIFQRPSRDSFDQRHGLVTSHDDVYGEVEELPIELPSTLTRREKRIVRLLLNDFPTERDGRLTGGARQSEIARRLRIDKRQMEREMRSIRLKLADWKPTATAAPSPERVAV